MEDKRNVIIRSNEKRVIALEIRMSELESENALILRALARLTENQAESLGVDIPGKSESSAN